MIRIRIDGTERTYDSLPITIGRDEDNDMPLDDAKLSRHHCRIVRTAEGVVIEDLESRNGTLVNGVPVRRRVLDPGDTVLIGITNFTVEWDREAKAPARARRGARPPSEVEEENARLRQLLTLAKSVAAERDEAALLRRIVDSAIELTGAERGFLFLVTLHGLDFRAARDRRNRDIERPEQKVSGSIARRAMETGRPVVTEDAGGDARFDGFKSVAFLKLRSVLCVPLKVPDGPLGAVYLENNEEPGTFHPRDVPIATAFADFAAIALKSARFVAEIRRSEEQIRKSRERISRLNERLKALLRRQSQELAGVRADLDVSRRELGLRYDYTSIVGPSEAMRNVLALLDRVTESEVAVLLQGESGTGKELLARSLHYNGPRRAGRFVAVNCAAIPPDLFEAEMFGWEAGAFTGAAAAREGLLEQADRGTLFLDEVSEMPLEAQAKLLRAVQEGEVRRLGGTESKKVSVRTVAASKKDLLEKVRAGAFREDLFYRLGGVVCRIPPLRDRVEDIPALFDHFLDLISSSRGVERPPVDPEVIDRMVAYPWPGNVRELENEVQRLLTLQRGAIGPDLLSFPVFSGDPGAAPPSTIPEGGLKSLVEDLEKRLLAETLRRVHGNKTRAAALLGLSRLGLRKKLERYGLS